MRHTRTRLFQTPFVAALALLTVALGVLRLWSVNEGVAQEPRLQPRPELLVDADWLAGRLEADNLRIVDLRGESEYAGGHIPGAVSMGAGALYTERNGVPGMLPALEVLQETFRGAGIGADTIVVAYDGGGGLLAARLYMALDVMGQPNGRLLDGGWGAWQAGGHPVSREIVRPTRSDLVLRPVPGAVVDLAWMREHIGTPDSVYVDARSTLEYEGQRSGSKRNGRIPGAVSVEWSRHLNAERGGRFQSPEALLELYAQQGVTPEKTVASYCQSETRGAHTYFTLKWLGFSDVRAYDGSWHEWGNRDDTPIETGPPRSQIPPSGPAAVAGSTASAQLAPGIDEARVRQLLGEPNRVEEQNPCWGRQAVWYFRPRDAGGQEMRLVFLDGILKEIGR